MDRPNEQAGDAAGETMTLTRAEIESVRNEWQKQWRGREDSDAYKSRMELCDLALSALSQEAVRDEVLEGAARLCENWRYAEHNYTAAGRWYKAGGFMNAIAGATDACATAIRALKREPNAAGEPHVDAPTGAIEEHGPAAPDVAEMVKRLRNYANESGGAQVEQDLLEAAALLELLGQRARSPAPLARLGQGWIPVSERLPEGDRQVLVTYNTGGADVLTRHAVRNLYEAAEIEGDGECFITHWMPLPPAP